MNGWGVVPAIAPICCWTYDDIGFILHREHVKKRSQEAEVKQWVTDMPGLPISGCTPPWNPVDIIDGVMLAPALNMGGKPGRAMGFRNVHDMHNSLAAELQYTNLAFPALVGAACWPGSEWLQTHPDTCGGV
jgi:hypothetical protein